MNAISHSSRKGALRIALLPLAVVLASYGQNTQINLATQGKNIDFTGAPFTRPVKTGTALPGTCSPGDLFFKIDAAAGQNLYACTAVNTWVPQSASAPAGLGDPGSNGIVVRTGVNTTSAVGAPVGAIVGTSDTQTLTNKSIDASQITTGTLSAARLPAFSGDISTSAGSSATTLANVNSTPGAYGDATHAVQLTVDSKGRITAVSQVAISGGGGGASIATGTLASLPVTCSVGTLYFATNQPAGQQFYQCDATNHFTQTLGLGASGALAVTSGLLDITSLVPLKAAANAFTGLDSFAVGQDMTEQASGTTPAAGKLHIYANTDHTFHQVTSAGVDTSLGGGTNTSPNHFASANYTILSTDQYVICDLAGAAANITLNLPAAPAGSTGSAVGQDIVVFVRPSASRACTVSGNGKTIYSPSAGQLATSVALSAAGRYQFHYDSADAITPRWESNF
jgi:hypothetical protein